MGSGMLRCESGHYPLALRLSALPDHPVRHARQQGRIRTAEHTLRAIAT
jgi:hypothetical protein